MLDEHAETTLASQLQARDHNAWTALYDQYSTPIWQYVARLVSPHSFATADIVQDVFMNAVDSIDQFQASRGRLWSWLTGIAHHRVQDHWRKVAVRLRHGARLQAEAVRDSRGPDTNPTLTDIFHNRELIEVVRFVLAELPTEYAGLLNAKYVDDQSLEELAQVFGGTVDSVKSKLARARREFRAKFEELTGETNPWIDS